MPLIVEFFFPYKIANKIAHQDVRFVEGEICVGQVVHRLIVTWHEA